MNFKGLFGALAVSVGMLLASYAPLANAGCLEKPGLVSLHLGASWLVSNNNFDFFAGNVNTAMVSTVTTTGVSVDMENDNFNWEIGFDAEYLGDMGFYVGLMAMWNQSDLKNTNTDTYVAAGGATMENYAFSIFGNVGYHSLASSNHDSDSSVGFGIGLGIGGAYVYDVQGAFVMTGVPYTMVASADNGTLKQTTGYSNGSSWVIAARATIGLEFVPSQNTFFAVNANVKWNGSADTLSSVNISQSSTAYTTVGIAPTGNAFLPNTAAISIPQTTDVSVDLRLGYNFGSSM